VDDLDLPWLRPDDHRHLVRVLRLRAGDLVTASDGNGRWRLCRLGAGPDLEQVGDLKVGSRPEPRLTVAFALVKGNRPELVVQKLTELGMDRIVPFVAARSVVRWDAAKAERAVARFATIAREAGMQSRRTFLPEVDPVTDFARVATLPGAALADPRGSAVSLATPTVLIGPEGGWAAEERAADLPTVRLADQVLRAETAALTTGALLGALRSRLVHDLVTSQVTDPHGP
jgi:16S rRNA (uracil1498-N3)-methyltransferase